MIPLTFISWLFVTVISLIVALLWCFVICRFWRGCGCPPGFWCTWVIAWLGSWLGTVFMGSWGPMFESLAIIPVVLGAFYIILFYCCLCWCWGGRDLTGAAKKKKEGDIG